MEMSGQLHTLAALFQVKGPQKPLNKGLGWTALQIWTLWEDKKCLVSANNQSTIYLSFSPVAIQLSYAHLIWGLGTGYSEKMYFVTARNIAVLLT